MTDFLDPLVEKAVGGTLEGTQLDTEALIKQAEEFSSQAVATIVIPDSFQDETQPGEPSGEAAAAADEVAAHRIRSMRYVHNMPNPMRSRTQVSPYHTCVLSSTTW